MFDLTAIVRDIYQFQTGALPPGVTDAHPHFAPPAPLPSIEDRWEALSDSQQEKIRNDFLDAEGLSMIAEVLEEPEADAVKHAMVYRRCWIAFRNSAVASLAS